MREPKHVKVPAPLAPVYVANGYVVRGEHGDLLADEQAMRPRVTEVLVARTVHEPADRERLAVTAQDLARLVFPVGLDDDDLLGVAAKQVWNLTQASDRGWVQMRLQDSGLLLCRATVQREGHRESVCYVTDCEQLILQDHVEAGVEDLVRYMQQVREDLEWMAGRVPAVREPAVAEYNKAVREAFGKLGVPVPENLLA